MTDFYNKTGNDVALYVKRQFGDESGVQINDEDIIRWINIAQLDLARENEFSRMRGYRDLEAGVHEYQFPDFEILATQTIYVNEKVIKFLTFQEYQEYIQKRDGYDVATSEVPEIWTEWGGTFIFWPTPKSSVNNAIKILFVAKPHDITDLSAKLSVPDRLFSVLLKMVMVHAYQLDEQFDAAGMQDQNVQNELGKMAYYPDRSSVNEYPSITILEEDEYGW